MTLSTIQSAGYGLVANRRYKKGERIVEYTGEIIDEATKRQRYPNNEGEYVMYVMRNMYIDAVDPNLSSLARYINSSGGDTTTLASEHTIYTVHTGSMSWQPVTSLLVKKYSCHTAARIT